MFRGEALFGSPRLAARNQIWGQNGRRIFAGVLLGESMTATAQALFSRRDREGQNRPLRVLTDSNGRRSYEVEIEGRTETHDTFKSLRTTLHGRTYRTWGWERYAEIGRWAPGETLGEPGLTIVQVDGPGLSPVLQGIVFYTPKHRGVDLTRRHNEVTRLLYAGFGRQIYANGYDFEDVQQEVYRKLVVANQGKSPWDPDKSSFGHYVHMVCRSALFNYHRKQNRQKAHEQVGLCGYGPAGESWTNRDVSTSQHARVDADAHPQEAVEDLSRHLLTCAQREGSPSSLHDAQLAVQALPYVREGYQRGEIAALLSLKPTLVSRGLAFLRAHARSWLH